MPAAREWDGGAYDRISAPMEALGREVLERLPLAGDETVLDAGCGSGRVTQALLDRLPAGRVIALDASAAMLDQARRRLGSDPRVSFVQADLAALALDEPVDAVLSTATFHWIADQDALYASLRRALRRGGRLAAQCGGEGNIGDVRAAIAAVVAADERFAAHLAGFDPWRFQGAAETERRLGAAGFASGRAWLEERAVATGDGRAWLRTLNLGSHLQRLPEPLREPFVEAVHAALGGEPLTLRYVRLNVDATV